MDRERTDSDFQEFIAEELGRHRRVGAPVDLEARAEQRRREREEVEDALAIRQALERRDLKGLRTAMQKARLPAEAIAQAEAMLAKLPPK